MIMKGPQRVFIVRKRNMLPFSFLVNVEGASSRQMTYGVEMKRSTFNTSFGLLTEFFGNEIPKSFFAACHAIHPQRLFGGKSISQVLRTMAACNWARIMSERKIETWNMLKCEHERRTNVLIVLLHELKKSSFATIRLSSFNIRNGIFTELKNFQKFSISSEPPVNLPQPTCACTTSSLCRVPNAASEETRA